MAEVYMNIINNLRKGNIDQRELDSLEHGFSQCFEELEKRDKVIDDYYKEKNDLKWQIAEMQAHIDCLKDELKSSQTYINCLESEKHNIRLRCHESAMDNFDNNMYGVLHVVTENELSKCTYDEQSHFIYENELRTAFLVASDELARLRSQKGL